MALRKPQGTEHWKSKHYIAPSAELLVGLEEAMDLS